ncbi:hypothetical protein [Gordonia rhizosphera]|uniref:Scaffolding protein n=1 Tax=Gordonia rhizosphera NBRC 16068 TaxID=1108045 RepID=K6VAC4_9ACTN|nr:hypothetical protein [Gordonia rhizosphera]GAB93158.1 hypothetical protein GORHZ_207_00070 [Gordonia rhizosphera NBRC 16068]
MANDAGTEQDTGTDESAVVEQQDSASDADGQQQDDKGKLSRESAKYRSERNAAREERDALKARVEAMQKAMVAKAVEAQGYKSAAFFAGNAGSVAELIAEDGSVDTEKLTAAIEVVRQDFNLAPVSRAPQVDPSLGQSNAGTADDSWVNAFKAEQ